MENSRDRPGVGRGALVTAAVYLLLFVLGAVQGVFGSFQYSRGPAPLTAIALDAAICATCLLAGWGMRTYGAGILPALGWLGASFILAMPRPNGSVVIAATAAGDAGEWYLYGGALSAMAGAIIALLAWTRPRPRPGPGR